jgi:hypothetical protein
MWRSDTPCIAVLWRPVSGDVMGAGPRRKVGRYAAQAAIAEDLSFTVIGS